MLSLLLWTACVKEKQELEPEKDKTEEQQTQNELKKPVKITATGKQYGSNKEIHFLYDDKGRVQKIQKCIKLTDSVVFEYSIDYDISNAYPKVTIKQYQVSGFLDNAEDVIKQGRLIETRYINYGDTFTQGYYNMNFSFEKDSFYEWKNNGGGVILFDGKGNVKCSDTGGNPIQLDCSNTTKYDDKNHPFKNLNVFLNPSFLDFDDNTGNWDWSGQETFLLLPIYPYEKAMKYVNNLIEYEYSVLNSWTNRRTSKIEKRQIVYDSDDFPTEITLSDGTKYVIEYNKKNQKK